MRSKRYSIKGKNQTRMANDRNPNNKAVEHNSNTNNWTTDFNRIAKYVKNG